MTPGRKAGSDGSIIIWDSPNTKVYHNTILANDNIFYSIEFRFVSTTNGEARNNLSDLPIHLRDSATATLSGNLLSATSSMFVNAAAANLHLVSTATVAIDQAPALPAVANDFDGEVRPQGSGYDIGADEFSSTPPPCMFCDDFEDSVLDPAWTYEKPTWTESGGSLNGVLASRKAIAIASPFAGCLVCAVESQVSLTGGIGNKVWILGWYMDKNNRMELLIKEEQDKIVLKQRTAGGIVTKQKGTVTILPNTTYIVRVVFDGTQFTVLIDGVSLFMLTPVSSVLSGTIGYQVMNTGASFGYIQVQ
ncbi:hypothetical protein L0222_23935 [bacterium]|nr:hypothetical protein [bacterium]